MSALLKFNKAKLKTLFDHTLANPVMRPMMQHMADETFWKPGAVPDQHGWVKSEDVDVSKIEPYLMLVKDSGIYLMSGSATRIPGTETMNHVIYAEGFDDKADYDVIVEAAGGDDFGEYLPLSWFEHELNQPGEYVQLQLQEDSIELVPENLTPKPR